jgi:hypothetical protein
MAQPMQLAAEGHAHLAFGSDDGDALTGVVDNTLTSVIFMLGGAETCLKNKDGNRSLHLRNAVRAASS